MPEELLLQNARVLLDDFVLRKRDIRIRRGRIAEIGSFPEEKGVDLNGKYPYKYWQYSSVGRVNGISTAVDMNTTVR